MPKVALYNMEAKQIGEVELNDNIFGAEVNVEVMHQVVKMQLANKRQGNQSALNKAAVSGGGIKPWKQKGTGRARQGSIRAPQWRHGGIVFPPTPRDFSYSVPKKIRRIALKAALSSKVVDKDFVVLDALKIEAPKTKIVADMINKFGGEKTLIIVKDSDEVIYKSTRNIEGVKVIPVNNLNVYDVLKYKKFIITQDAVKKVEEVYA